jgi:hypothetical protein
MAAPAPVHDNCPASAAADLFIHIYELCKGVGRMHTNHCWESQLAVLQSLWSVSAAHRPDLSRAERRKFTIFRSEKIFLLVIDGAINCLLTVSTAESALLATLLIFA